MSLGADCGLMVMLPGPLPAAGLDPDEAAAPSAAAWAYRRWRRLVPGTLFRRKKDEFSKGSAPGSS